jgi:hypothetical protein
MNPGDVVQLIPDKTRNRAFAGCLFVITEVKPWGAQGYVQALGMNRDIDGGQAYYRAKTEEMSHVIGQVPYFISSE